MSDNTSIHSVEADPITYGLAFVGALLLIGLVVAVIMMIVNDINVVSWFEYLDNGPPISTTTCTTDADCASNSDGYTVCGVQKKCIVAECTSNDDCTQDGFSRCDTTAKKCVPLRAQQKLFIHPGGRNIDGDAISLLIHLPTDWHIAKALIGQQIEDVTSRSRDNYQDVTLRLREWIKPGDKVLLKQGDYVSRLILNYSSACVQDDEDKDKNLGLYVLMEEDYPTYNESVSSSTVGDSSLDWHSDIDVDQATSCPSGDVNNCFIADPLKMSYDYDDDEKKSVLKTGTDLDAAVTNSKWVEGSQTYWVPKYCKDVFNVNADSPDWTGFVNRKAAPAKCAVQECLDRNAELTEKTDCDAVESGKDKYFLWTSVEDMELAYDGPGPSRVTKDSARECMEACAVEDTCGAWEWDGAADCRLFNSDLTPSENTHGTLDLVGRYMGFMKA